MHHETTMQVPAPGRQDRPNIPVEWNTTTRDYPADRSLHEFIEDQVARAPNAPAVIYGSEELSYGQLNARANRLARYLRKHGVGPDVLVGVCAERSMEMLVALLAVMKAGGAYLPIDPEYPRERLATLLEDARPPVLVAQDRMRGALPDYNGFQIFLNEDVPRFADEPNTNPPAITHGKHLAYGIYTSGSTGMPKCVLNVHQAIVNLLLWMQDRYRLDANDRVLVKTPYTFDVSLLELFWPLTAGACIVVAKPGGHKDPKYLIDMITGHSITAINFVPSMLRVFLEAPGIERCTSLRHVFSSGEALPASLQEAFFQRLDARLHNLYGPAEAAVEVTAWTCRRGSPHANVPIGKPIWNTRIYILDAAGEPVPPGVAGELHIGGVALARGYLNRPELTAHKFIPDRLSKEPEARLYKTGDLARFLPDGNIEYLGRIDHQVKIRGIRIEPGEIEAVLSNHPGVRQAVVVAREDRSSVKRLIAYIVPRGEAVPIRDLRELVRAKLPEAMMPAAFVALDALPLTSSGKLDRNRLPLVSSTDSRGRILVSPRDSLESTLCKIWEEVLDVRPIGIDDNFSDLGGDSLAAASLFVRVQQIYGENLEAVNLLGAATVRAMAEVLRSGGRGSQSKSLVTLQANGARPPLFLISGIYGHVTIFFNLAMRLGADQPSYALQPPGIDSSTPHLTRLEDLAAHYIREIKSRQPAGPYHLAGYSLGGMIAFEMAQQLLGRGDRVAIMALLDASEWRYERRMRRIMNLNRIVFGPKRVEFVTNAIRERSPLLIRKMRASLGRRASPAPLTTFEASWLAANRYVPKVYPGTLTLLRTAANWPLAADDPLLGWGRLVRGGIEVYEIAGSHLKITEEPYVGILAQKLRACLERVQPAGQDPAVMGCAGDQGIAPDSGRIGGAAVGA